MDLLLEKLNEYKSITGYRMEYVLEDESTIDFKLRLAGFPHLIGLHKLTDIPLIELFNDVSNPTVSARYIISQIRHQNTLTDNIVRSSKYFYKIQTRYDSFTRDNLLTLSYTDAIVDFDPASIGSMLKANYILFEQKKSKEYNHLFIAENNNGTKYAESFINDNTDYYIRNQRIIKVKTVRIYDADGNLYIEDKLIVPSTPNIK